MDWISRRGVGVGTTTISTTRDDDNTRRKQQREIQAVTDGDVRGILRNGVVLGSEDIGFSVGEEDTEGDG